MIELAWDWKARHAPPIKFSGGLQVSELTRVPDHTYGQESGYFISATGQIFFFLPRDPVPESGAKPAAIYLAGDFNGWGDAIGDEAWALTEASLDGDPVWLWQGDAEPFRASPPQRFKFATAAGHWLPVPDDAPNIDADQGGNRNRVIDPDRTGRHLFQFELSEPIDLAHAWRVFWSGREGEFSAPLKPGAFFHQLSTDLTLGAWVENGNTWFRLFAPRARRVDLVLQDEAGTEETFLLTRRTEGSAGDRAVWELELPGDLQGSDHR